MGILNGAPWWKSGSATWDNPKYYRLHGSKIFPYPVLLGGDAPDFWKFLAIFLPITQALAAPEAKQAKQQRRPNPRPEPLPEPRLQLLLQDPPQLR